MYLTSGEIEQFDESKLGTFVQNRISEGLYLDYKENLTRGSDREAKVEFLKDITAFANAHGGDILIGIREPSEGIDAHQQIVGIENGEQIAHDLERVASSSVDPRIPGLRIISVQLASGRWCVIVHIPPSLSRPHMVNYQGHRSFYIRHSESSHPMTSHEIRESVVLSLSAEARVKLYLETAEREDRAYYLKGNPSFIIQAMPLISLEQPWDIYTPEFEQIVRGNSRKNKHGEQYSLSTEIAPQITINGIIGMNERLNPVFRTEVHRNGYVSAIYRNLQTQTVDTLERPVVHSTLCKLFNAFSDFISELWEATATELPYLFGCKYVGAQGTVLWTETRSQKFTQPYERDEIVWPIHYRQPNQDPTLIMNSICVELFNAFGFREVIK